MGYITIRIMFFSATSRLIFHAYCGGDVGGFFVASISTFFHTALDDDGGEEIKGPFTSHAFIFILEWNGTKYIPQHAAKKFKLPCYHYYFFD